MRTSFIVLTMGTIIAISCNNSPKDPQADPRALAEAIFDAAKNENYASLPTLVDADADGDSKMIAQAASDVNIQKEFKKHFEKGKVSADPVVNGEAASVKILFGPDGTKEETFEMVKKDGKWYLHSF
jgi:hypothetical protein